MNWGEIKAAVQQYLENREETFVGNLGLYARLAEEDIYRQVQLQAAKSLVVATVLRLDRFVEPPTTILSVYSLSYIDPVTGAHTMLLPKDLGYLKEAYPNPATLGPPRYYCWRDTASLMLAPTPDRAYNLELYFFRQPDSISKDNVPAFKTWLSVNGENALLFGILYHGYINEKGDQDVIQAYKAQFDKGIQDLKVIAEGRQKTDNYRIPA